MERERFCWHSHLKRMRYVPNVPLRISYHELRVHSREPLHEGIYKHYRSSCPRLIFLLLSAVASLPHSSCSRRHRLINAVLPRHITDSCVFRPTPGVCDGHRYVRVWRRWTGFRSCHPVIARPLWCTCDTTYSWGVELCDLRLSLFRYSAPSGV